MPEQPRWTVVLVRPDEEQLSLLANLSARRNVTIAAIYDPEGTSAGASLAPILGLRVIDDLAVLDEDEARYLVHPPRDDRNAAVIDEAPEHGLEPVPAADFPALLAADTLTRRRRTVAAPDSRAREFLEQETAAIHRTLSRIEEALDGESLLRWLLSLALRATAASSGSILLFDEASEELYVGFAHGLSQSTLHSTRVRLGEGIAGQVARSREAQWIRDNRHPGARRDRGELRTAISCPLVWEGMLLGVLNVSTDQGEPELRDDALAVLESLTHRFGMILDRFQRLQRVVHGEVFRELDENFALAVEETAEPGEILAIWVEDIARACAASRATLTIPTIDGELLVADPDGLGYPGGSGGSGGGAEETLASGRPRIDRIEPEEGIATGPITEFSLPVGSPPACAALTLQFDSAVAAHEFHAISGEILYLLNKHLDRLLERIRARDEVGRLTALAGVLSEVPPAAGIDQEERILAAARELTGAQQAFLLFAPLEPGGDAPSSNPDERLLAVADDLLGQARERGHLASVMTVVRDPELGMPRSVLAVPLHESRAYPGLVLLDKKRLHPLDGKSFTEFDALFARRLAPLFVDAAPAPDAAPASAADAKVVALPVKPAAGAQPTPANRPMEDLLRREMDRCDRYHNMFGLVAFRFASDDLAAAEAPRLAEALACELRSSDTAGCLEDGTVLILVPEDIQSLPRLRNRALAILLRLAGDEEAALKTATRVYPGGGDTANELLGSLLKSLH